MGGSRPMGSTGLCGEKGGRPMGLTGVCGEKWWVRAGQWGLR